MTAKEDPQKMKEHTGKKPRPEIDVRVKQNKSSKTAELKDRAAERLTRLLKFGERADKLAARMLPVRDGTEKDALEFQAKIAGLPKLVQFAYHRGRYNDLRKELKALNDGGNRRKFELMEPIIQREIADAEDKMYDLYDEIKAEGKIIGRKYRKR